MRRALLILLLAVVLAAPAGAAAKTVTVSAGDMTAKLTYTNAPAKSGAGEQLLITEHGKTVYDQPVPASGCFHVCTPAGHMPLQLADLYGDGSQDVVLTLFTGGADCCTIADVYVPSAAVHSYVLDHHNFGEDGFLVKNIGPHNRPEFVSADPAFYCRFSACYESGLPLQILQFSEERFTDVTKHYPKLIAADASKWLKLYYENPSQGLGVIVAWAGDEDNLGDQATVSTVLQRQIADHHLKQSFVTSLEQFLAQHGYKQAAAGAAAMAVPRTVSTSRDGVTATLTSDKRKGSLYSSHASVAITDSGRQVFKAPVSKPHCGNYCVFGSRPLSMIEFAGRYDPVLDTYTGGAHCCSYVDVYSRNGSGVWTDTGFNFGDPGFRLESIGPDGQTVFVTANDAFAYTFTDYAESGMPLLILQFNGHGFSDITRSYPALIRKDLKSLWKAYQHDRTSGAIGLIAAWAADEDNLGRQAEASSTLARQTSLHRITGAQVRHLRSFLAKFGYTH